MFCGWKHCPEEAHLNRWAKRWLIIKYNHQKSLFICLFEQKYVCMAWASTNKRDCDAWSLLLLAAAVRSFAHMPLGISDRNNIISLMSLAIIFLAILSSRIGDAIAICRTTAESLVNHLVGQIVSRESVWMDLPHHICSHFDLSDCVYSLWSWCMWFLLLSIYAFHYTNNGIQHTAKYNTPLLLNLTKNSSAQVSLAFLWWKFVQPFVRIFGNLA